MIKKSDIEKILKKIPDPELNISIWDLGLVYGIDIDKRGVVTVRMTLTSIGCPLFDLIQTPIVEKVGKLKGVKKVNVELTFEHPWSPEKMTKEAKVELGMV
ncbi:metal-sulfur cluster assembly factor [Patescibacteria group bacterium]